MVCTTHPPHHADLTVRPMTVITAWIKYRKKIGRTKRALERKGLCTITRHYCTSIRSNQLLAGGVRKRVVGFVNYAAATHRYPKGLDLSNKREQAAINLGAVNN